MRHAVLDHARRRCSMRRASSSGMPSRASPTSSSKRSVGTSITAGSLRTAERNNVAGGGRRSTCSTTSTRRSGVRSPRPPARLPSWRRRVGQDPGAHPAHRLAGRDRATPTPATSSPSPSPARRRASSATGSGRSACATAWPPARSTAWPTPSSERGGPTRGAPPPDAARPQGSAARTTSSAARGQSQLSVAQLAAEIEWAKARLVGPDGYAEAVAAARAAHARAAQADRRPVPRATRRPSARPGWSTSTTCCGCAATCSRPTPPSPPPSAGGSATCSSTSSRTSTRCSCGCSTPGGATSYDLCVVGDPHQAIYGWNGADAGFLEGFRRLYPPADVIVL